MLQRTASMPAWIGAERQNWNQERPTQRQTRCNQLQALRCRHPRHPLTSRAPRVEADWAAFAATGSRSPSRVLAGRSCLCLATALGGNPLVIRWTQLGRLLSRTKCNPTESQTDGIPGLSAHSRQAKGADLSRLPHKYHTRLLNSKR